MNKILIIVGVLVSLKTYAQIPDGGSLVAIHTVASTNFASITSPSEGMLAYDSTLNLLFVYDGERNKWLSVDRTMVGWGFNSNNTTNRYLRQFNGADSNRAGWRMIRKGTITGVSVQTNSTNGGQTWTLEIRKNDITTAIVSLSVSNTPGAHDATIDIDVEEGDFLQAYCNGNSIDYPEALIEIAWRN